jgi:hypothetical protein
LPVEQFAAHERGEEGGGVLGVGDDAAFGADAGRASMFFPHCATWLMNAARISRARDSSLAV